MTISDYEREHLATIRKGLPECMVLLKKNGEFPLKEAGSLAAFGNGIRHSIKGGTGSGEVNSRYFVNIEQGLLDAGFSITSTEWLKAYDEIRANAEKYFYTKGLKAEAKEKGVPVFAYAMGATMLEPEYDLALTGEGDAALYVVSRISGEGNDRKVKKGDILLSDSEVRDILALNKKFKKFLLVINAGGPVDLSPVMEVGNILVLSQLGVEMGSALADLMLGKTYPSGKLTTTWSAWEDYCQDIDFGDVETTLYKEGVYVGYRYFDTVGKKALFPFGFGLGYTEFEISDSEVKVDGTVVSITAKVTNAGTVAGKEVVQIYVTAPEKNIKKPFQSLAGFAKTKELLAGESDTLTVVFDLKDMSSYSETDASMILEEGNYIVRIGNSSVSTKVAAVIALDGDVCVQKVRSIVAKAELEECVYDRVNKAEDISLVPVIAVSSSAFETVNTVYDKEIETAKEVEELTTEEIVSLSIGNFNKKSDNNSVIGSAGTHVVGAAGESTHILSKDIKPMIMADGPAGLRLAKQFFKDKDGSLKSYGMGIMPESIYATMPGIVKLVIKLFFTPNPPKNVKIEEQYCTAIPIGTAIAQTWNLDFAKACGDVVGEEMEKFGVHLWLAPALNIHRSIRCGRNFEYFSEDPVISGKFAAALTKGVQSHKGCGTTIKHFAANNQETNRYFNNGIVSERALREIYLRGFGICVKESQPAAVMTSYNLINGKHSSETRGLIEDYLRAENGYEGIVMTDWIITMIPSMGGKHRNSLSHETAKAGSDVFMPGCKADYDNMIKALEDGSLTRHQLNMNCTRLYNMSKKLNP